MKKKLFSLFLLLTFVIGNLNITAYGKVNNDYGIFYAEEVKEGFEKSIAEIDADMLAMMQSSMMIYNNAVEQIGFDDLGGAYYDDEGMLHILFKQDIALQRKNNSLLTLNQLANETDIEDAVCIEYCKYSYNELMEFKAIIREYFSEDGIFAAGIDDEFNKVNVYAKKDTDLSILDNLVPYDVINIVEGEFGFQNTASYTARPGSGLYNSSKNSDATLACGVVWDQSTSNPQYGYLTAGHFASAKDQIISLYASKGWVELGKVVKTKSSGKIDAALISRTNSDVTSSSTAIDGSTYLFYGGVPAKNKPITAHGSYSGTVTGVVLDTSYDFGDFTDLVWTSAIIQSGDSGGAVIAPITTPELSICGVIKGAVTLLGVNEGMVYTKFNNITNEWDVGALK